MKLCGFLESLVGLVGNRAGLSLKVLLFSVILLILSGCGSIPANLALPKQPGVNSVGLWLPWWVLTICAIVASLAVGYFVYKMQHIPSRLVVLLALAYMSLKIMALSVGTRWKIDENGQWNGITDFVVQFGSSNWDTLIVILFAMYIIFRLGGKETNTEMDLEKWVAKYVDKRMIFEYFLRKSCNHHLLRTAFGENMLYKKDPLLHPSWSVWLYLKIYGKEKFEKVFEAAFIECMYNMLKFTIFLHSHVSHVITELNKIQSTQESSVAALIQEIGEQIRKEEERRSGSSP